MDDDEALAGYATALADGIEAALGPWVRRSITVIAEAWESGLADQLAAPAATAADAAAADIVPRVRALLSTDVDAQRTGPLAVVREAVRYPTEVLRDAGVPAIERDPFVIQAFPEDDYGLVPAAFADLDPRLQEPGMVWGAAKAHVVLARRRAEGLR